MFHKTQAVSLTMTAFFFCLPFAAPARAQTGSEMDRIKSIRQSVNGDTLRIVVETEHAPPEASVFFSTGPERLVIEFNDALPGTSAPAPPNTPMVESWGLKQVSLNRSQLVLNLDHRPPTSRVGVQTLTGPHRFVVDLPLASEWREEMALTKGIRWIREDRYLSGLWVRLNRVHFDPTDSNVSVAIGLAKEVTNARETVSSMVARYNAVAGINGGFFASSGGALGLVYRDGKMLAPHVSRRPPRSGFGMTKDGQPLFGRLAATGQAIKDLDGGDWTKTWMALGGGPRLIKDGSAKITAKEEELGPGGNDITRVAARSLVGQTKSGDLVFSTVTGFRDNHSQGAKFEPVVDWLRGLGVKDAVNFDGGASVDMVIGDHIVSDGPGNSTKEKPVATALLVKDSREKLYPSKADWVLSQTALKADGKSSADALITLKTESGGLVADGTPVRFFAHGLVIEPAEAKTSKGQVKVRLTSIRSPGTSRLSVLSGPLSSYKDVTLQGGEPKRLQVELLGRKKTKVEGIGELQRVNMKVQLTDPWGNPVANEVFQVAVNGTQAYPFRTDTRGMSSLEVETALAGGTILVTHPKAGDTPVKIDPLP